MARRASNNPASPNPWPRDSGPRIRRDLTLERLAQVKHREHPKANPLGPELIKFFKTSVIRQQGKFGKIAASWNVLVPAMLNDHCALEAFTRGSLTVLVDSSSHLYELKQLLLAGLEQQLKIACKSSGLSKVVLKHGRWYQIADDKTRRLRFDR